jgi:hypothetical protein
MYSLCKILLNSKKEGCVHHFDEVARCIISISKNRWSRNPTPARPVASGLGASAHGATLDLIGGYHITTTSYFPRPISSLPFSSPYHFFLPRRIFIQISITAPFRCVDSSTTSTQQRPAALPLRMTSHCR